MNRQSTMTFFVLCSLLTFKFGYSSLSYMVEKTQYVNELRELKKTDKVTQQREFVLPQDVILKSHLRLARNEQFKRNVGTVVEQMVEEQHFLNTEENEYPRGRDP